MPRPWPLCQTAGALALFLFGAGAQEEAPTDALALIQGSLAQGASSGSTQQGPEAEGELPADPLAGVRLSARLHKRVVEEKARHLQPQPWFFSPRLDGHQLGRAAWRRQELRELAEEKGKRDRLALSRLQGKPEEIGDWPINVTTADPSDLGRIFFKEMSWDNPGWFHLRTIFGRYVAMNPVGYMTANRQTPWGPGARFTFVPHPLFPKKICWMAYNGLCAKHTFDESGTGELGIGKPEEGDNRTAVQVTESWGPDGLRVLLTFDSAKTADGLVVSAALNKAVMAQWTVSQEDSRPLEMQMYLADFVPSNERLGRKRGLVAGLLLGGLIFLLAYNVHFAITDKTPAPKARMPNFDILRFLLETLVIHTHLVLLGLLAIEMPMHPQYMSTFRMPAFLIISGIFGSNMTYESVSRVLCCTLGTFLLMICVRLVEYRVIWGPEHVWANLGKNWHLELVAPGLWFLPALAGMRLLVSPLFHFARKLQVRTVVPFMFVKVASYFIMHWTKNWNGWILSAYLWNAFLAFSPFFALGLLCSPKDWDAFLKKRWVQALSLVYFIAWYLLTLSPGFLQWNSSYCMPQFQKKGCGAHYDEESITGPVNIETFLLDLVFFGLRLGISVSFMGVAVLVCEVVGLVAPRLIELMAGWGSRTLYAYVLHIHIFTLLGEDSLFYFKGPNPDPKWLVNVKWAVNVLVPVGLNVLLSSQGSEHWFRWLLMPFWIKDLFEGNLISYKSLTSRLTPWAKLRNGPAD